MNPILHIVSLWRGRAGALVAATLITIASAGCGVALLAMSGASIGVVLAGGAIAAPLALQVLGPSRVITRYLERLVAHGVTFRALADLRVWFFRGFALRSAGGLGFRPAGDLISRIVTDVEALDGLLIRILLPLLAALVVVPAIAVLVGQISLTAGIAVGSLMGCAAFAMPGLMARDAARQGAAEAEATSALRVLALDTVTGLREVRAFGAEARLSARIAQAESCLIGLQRGAARRIARYNAAAFVLCQVSLLAALLIAAGAAEHDATRVACVFMVLAGFEVVTLLPRAGLAEAQAATAARRVLDVAEGPIPVPEPVSPRPVPPGHGLRFEAVHFAWSPGSPKVLNGLTMDIPAGGHVALLGPSGAGKSTLAALALKVARPQAGRITLDGVDIADLPAEKLRHRIAWLSQTTHIFDDTIRNNLLLGMPSASEADLWQALDRAAIGDWVRGLPERLDTWLGEGGARVSGGQGRRIALARALLSDAPILILDEPAAGLDAETERAFLATLFAQSEGRTVLLIAHRLTGAERLSRIWRLSGGQAMSAAA
jgi:ATP-binding cassette subfamily C protein CydC